MTNNEITVPESNKTSLGLYVTPQEAYAMWQADPEGVHFLDVRTFEEYIFVGHIEMARNIPFVYPKFKPPDEDEAASAAAAACSRAPSASPTSATPIVTTTTD